MPRRYHRALKVAFAAPRRFSSNYRKMRGAFDENSNQSARDDAVRTIKPLCRRRGMHGNEMFTINASFTMPPHRQPSVHHYRR